MIRGNGLENEIQTLPFCIVDVQNATRLLWNTSKFEAELYHFRTIIYLYPPPYRIPARVMERVMILSRPS